MRKFAVAVATLGLLAWSAPAWAVVGETTVKVADGATPIPGATVTVTFKDAAGTPIQTVKRKTRRARSSAGTVTAKIPDNAATADIAVRTANGKTETRSGVDVALLDDKTFAIDVPGGTPPQSQPRRGPSVATPVMPPPVEGPDGTVIGIGLGVQSTACNNWKTTGLVSLSVSDPIGENPEACFSSAFRPSVYLGTSRRVGASYLAGIEADLGITNSSKTVNGIPGTVGGIPGLTAAAAANDSVTVKKIWDGSVRGRFGYFLTPRTVVYGTGGLALQQIEATVNCTAAGACGVAGGLVASSTTNSEMLVGWTLGGGAETALTDRIVGRVEYRYADYGTFTSTYGSAANIAVTSDIALRTHTVLVGLGVKLGGGR